MMCQGQLKGTRSLNMCRSSKCLTFSLWLCKQAQLLQMTDASTATYVRQ